MLILYLGIFNLEHEFVVLVDQRFNLEINKVKLWFM